MRNKFLLNLVTIFLLSVFSTSWASSNIRSLSSALKNKVLQKLGENPEKVSENVGKLRTWVKNQPHLKSRIDDQFLASFLRRDKYNLEAAQERLDAFYSVRSTFPDVFEKRNIFKNPKLRDFLQTGTFVLMPPSDNDVPAVAILRLGAFDPKKHPFEDLGNLLAMGFGLSGLENDIAVISGIQIVYDCTNVTEDHVSQYTAEVFQKYVLINVDISPVEIIGYHFTNVSPIMEPGIELLKTVLDTTMRQRVYKHSDYESLYKFVSKDLLPVEYGGPKYTMPELVDNLEKLLEKYADYYDEDERNFGSIEKLRTGVSPVKKFGRRFSDLPKIIADNLKLDL